MVQSYIPLKQTDSRTLSNAYVIGAIVGGVSSGGVSASSQGDVFVDRYGNEYISTSAQFRIYGGDETWNTSKKYHIKGQSGTFYRKIK